MKKNYDAQLAKFIRKRRGELSYAKFGKLCGLAPMTILRIEKGEHHLTLNKLETVTTKFKIKLRDIFPNEF